MITQQKQSGFTAVELLITLFVAAAFLIAGYQLFNVVIKDGGQARAESTAGNVAYDYLRRYAPQATNPCTAGTVLDNAAVTVDGLSNVRITVTMSCPPGYSTPAVSKVEATITYNTPQQTSIYSTYTNGIASGTTADVTNGLVGWWRLNGNTAASVGDDAVNTGASPTTGQNGSPNTAYSFDGVNDYMTVSNAALLPTSTITVSFWARPSGTGSSGVISTFPDSTTNRLVIFFPWAGNIMWDFGSDTTRASVAWNAGWSNQWALWTFTADANGRAVYRNGSLLVSNATTANLTPSTLTGIYFGVRTGGYYWNGSLDDVRFYNRVLSSTDITALYNGGAK